jgi:hypothetical protein
MNDPLSNRSELVLYLGGPGAAVVGVVGAVPGAIEHAPEVPLGLQSIVDQRL